MGINCTADQLAKLVADVQRLKPAESRAEVTVYVLDGRAEVGVELPGPEGSNRDYNCDDRTDAHAYFGGLDSLQNDLIDAGWEMS